MATVNKDFRIKHGLVVEGDSGTINGEDILTTGSTTDSLDEGSTNQYFTDERAKDSAASLLTNATLTNITITGDGDGLTISAENGVDDATTDDLDEGTTNLYFTNQRAQDAVTENLTTDDLDEGQTNLYYTDTRARNAISAGDGIVYDVQSGEIQVDTDVIATKLYVDEVAQGIVAKPAVEAATTANLSGTYDNGTNGVDATLTLAASATLDIDGWTTWGLGDGVLVKNQTSAFENGRYFIDQVGDADTAWILKRCIYCDESDEIAGSYFFVKHGSANASTGWVATVENPGSFIIGTDDITITQFSGAGTYTDGTGIALDGTVFSIDFTEFDTDDIDEGETNLFYTDARVENVIANSTTDNIDEGSANLYYTEQRVKDLLTGSTQTNISITEVAGDLVITAENGVDDATTDDLDEGTTNKYFTDQRAVDAIEAVTPNLPAVKINSIAKNVANTKTVTSSATPEAIITFSKTDFRSAKFLVRASFGTNTHVSEVLLTLDTDDNIAITEYAMVQTDGSLLDITADISGTDVRLIADVANSSTAVDVFGTLL